MAEISCPICGNHYIVPDHVNDFICPCQRAESFKVWKDGSGTSWEDEYPSGIRLEVTQAQKGGNSDD